MEMDRFFPQYAQAVRSLKQAFVNGKGMHLALADKSNYYSTSTATALLALHSIGELTTMERIDLHRTLIRMRSTKINPGDVTKSPTDAAAWDTQEGALVWNTSLAVWALAATGYRGPELGDALRWIIQCYNRTEGFSPQANDLNLFVAACALQAIRRANYTEQCRPVANDIVRWVRNHAIAHEGMFGWACPPSNHPDPTFTLCALWILRDHGDLAHDEPLVQGGLSFLRSTLQGHPGMWPMTQVYAQLPLAGHAAQVIGSYTPSFVIPLLQMGIDPFDRLVLDPIRWLRQHVITANGGKIVGWDTQAHMSVPLSFTTAYALWAIRSWANAVARLAHKETLVPGTASVFFVHGHDRGNVVPELQGLLNSWGVAQTHVVRQAHGPLDTIFSLVTTTAKRCDYAIVLLLPDDMGALEDATPRQLRPRARQNVVLELGLFLGLFGQERLTIIRDSDVAGENEFELPSDLTGLRFIYMNQADWRIRLHHSLRAAGVVN